MTPERRTLRFDRFDDIMPDVERLLAGHATVGAWSLAQICRHLATVMRHDKYASTAWQRFASSSVRWLTTFCGLAASYGRSRAV